MRKILTYTLSDNLEVKMRAIMFIHHPLKTILFEMAFGVLYCVFWLLHICRKLKSDILWKPDQNFPLFEQWVI